MELFLTKPVEIASLWGKHQLKPIVGDWFGWEQQPEQGHPQGANILGVLLVEHLGWEAALRLYEGEDVPEVWEDQHSLDGAVVGRVDIGQGVTAAEALGISFMALWWLMLGWDWEYKGTDRQFELPEGVHEAIGCTAYKMGVETRIAVENEHTVIGVEAK